MKQVFAISQSSLPCAVTQFTKGLARKSEGEITDLSSFKPIKNCDNFIINLPLIGWKKTFFKPFFAQLYANIKGKQRIVYLHEWEDLNWKRRIVISPILLLANKIMLSSPLILKQLEGSILASFITKNKVLFPVPSNLKLQLGAEPLRASLKIGHFGSIYSSKNSLELLNIAARLKAIAPEFQFIFIGDFVKDSQDIETQFYTKVKELGLENHVKVTGYIADLTELMTLFQQMSCFVYPFSEGLTSRRSSVLAVAQAGRPILTTKPQLSHEFDHHSQFKSIIASGIVHYCENFEKEIIFFSIK